MKRIITIGVIVSMLVLVLNGCGKKGADTRELKELFSDLSTTDLEGNGATSSIFKENELTMINTWTTWCSACVGELPDLEQLQKELKQEGISVGIKGMIFDTKGTSLKAGLSEKEQKLANEIIKNTGVTYQQLFVSEKLSKSALSQQQGFPTTYFVDQNGKLVGDPVVGSNDKEGWRKIIEKKLKEVK